jgi:hypothetical protein
MLSFLKLRAVVNGKEIYPLLNTKPVVISVNENNPRIVITDGYHFTRPLKLIYNDIPVSCFNVVCAINDFQLGLGFAALSILYLGGYLTGILIMKIFSFLPLIYLLTFYYMNRKDFLKLVPVQN